MKVKQLRRSNDICVDGDWVWLTHAKNLEPISLLTAGEKKFDIEKHAHNVYPDHLWPLVADVIACSIENSRTAEEECLSRFIQEIGINKADVLARN